MAGIRDSNCWLLKLNENNNLGMLFLIPATPRFVFDPPISAPKTNEE
jgi:hypothetical protein